MIRRALFDLFLFLLPFVVYVLYLRFAPKREEAKKEAPARAHPWTLLCISGLVLVVLSFVWLGLEEGQAERGDYVPPHVENGKVVPGRIDTEDKNSP